MPPKWTAGDIRGWRIRGAKKQQYKMDKDQLCEEQAGKPPSRTLTRWYEP